MFQYFSLFLGGWCFNTIGVKPYLHISQHSFQVSMRDTHRWLFVSDRGMFVGFITFQSWSLHQVTAKVNVFELKWTIYSPIKHICHVFSYVLIILNISVWKSLFLATSDLQITIFWFMKLLFVLQFLSESSHSRKLLLRRFNI